MTQRTTLIFMVLAAAMSRFVPHPWNFTAIGAMALFGGAHFESKKQSLLIPLAALLLSDLALGFHSTMPFVYAAFALTGLLGWSLKENKSVFRIASLSLFSSSLFFVITNFGTWLMAGFYPQTTAGLVQCFVAAIPFFDNQIYGDLFFSGLLFGGYEALKYFAPEFVSNSKSV